MKHKTAAFLVMFLPWLAGGSVADDCQGGLVADDGTAENAYGWGTTDLLVQRFAPSGYPYLLTRACVAWTQASGDQSITYDVVVFDDDGPGGAPGTPLLAFGEGAGGIPLWLDLAWIGTDVSASGLIIENGAFYVGVDWNDAVNSGFYVAADESASTNRSLGYVDVSGEWVRTEIPFPSYRSLLMRVDGVPGSTGGWHQIVGEVAPIGNGFGNPTNTIASFFEIFNDGAVVGTTNATTGAELWRTEDGEFWAKIGPSGFGDPDVVVASAAEVFQGSLYVGAHRRFAGAQVWRVAPDHEFQVVVDDAFGDPANAFVNSIQVFSGSLYAGTLNNDGCQVWRTDGGESWQQCHMSGFGDPANSRAESMAVFDDQLYVGTANNSGCEVWRTSDGVVWFPVITGGFGDPDNYIAAVMTVFNDALYLGTTYLDTHRQQLISQVWRSENGENWERVGEFFGVVPGGGGVASMASNDGKLYLGVTSAFSGCQVWWSNDGASWVSDTTDGFEDPENEMLTALGVFDGRVYAGTGNHSQGLEVWALTLAPIFADGFESGDFGAW